MKQLILIKYGELTTKKDNRNVFINILANNINLVLNGMEYKIIKNRVRMFIEINHKDLDKVVSKLKKVFGIYSIVICEQVNNNIDDIENKVLSLLKNKKFKTFKIETNRSDKKFPITSMEVSRRVGGFVLKNMECKVDVHKPDVLVFIEIRENYSYIYLDEIKGLGGYPVGVQGKGLLMLSGGIDSPVAGYLAMKRGITVHGLYFESPPHTSMQAKEKVIKLSSILNDYSGHFKLHVVPFTKLQEEIYKNVPDEYVITIMRRMMYRIAEGYALKNNFKIIINGESVGQVASQTLSSMVCINSVTNYPVIRPVCCLDKLEIIALSKQIGTYETSILPYEDCCTVFVPKHPVINPIIEKCLDYEKRFDYENLVNECINNIEVININNIQTDDLL